jgi:NAD(P)-dependent dehydrogenase (short-subunit alcohol dehydrogenase family)
MSLLENKVAFITGAGSGIGKAGAKLIAANGAHVIVTDKNNKLAKKTTREIVKNGGSSEAFYCDVSEISQIKDCISEITKTYHHIDIVHSHVGIQVGGSLEDVDVSEFDKSWGINVRSHFIIAQQFIPMMRENGGGSFIITSSNSGILYDKEMIAYATSKHAAVAMTKQLALDYAKHNIRFNVLCPGWVDTSFNDPFTKQMGGRDSLLEYVNSCIPMARFATAEEIAEAILFLASNRSSFMTGQALVVDGGESL